MIRLEHHSVNIGGIKAHYVEVGRGPYLVLVHGWFQSWREFSPILPKLSQHFHLILLDLPGFGVSEELPFKHTLKAYVDFLEEFVKTIPGKVYLLGVSTGGLISALFAAQSRSKKVKRLILLNTPVYFPKKLCWQVLKNLSKFVLAHPTLEKFARKIFARKKLVTVLARPLGIPARVAWDAEPREVRAAMESLSDLFDTDLRSKVREIKSPTLLIATSGDSIALPQMIKRFSCLLPEGTFRVIEEESHFNTLRDHHSQLEKMVLSFLVEPWYRRLWDGLRGILRKKSA